MPIKKKQKASNIIFQKIADFFENFTLLNTIKISVFVILVSLSLLYNLSMFYQLGSTELEKYLFMLASIAIEGAKIYFLINASRLLGIAKLYNEDSDEIIRNSENIKEIKKERKKKIFRSFPSFREYILYFSFSILSVFASYGYTLSTIDKMNTEAKNNQQVVVDSSNKTNINDLEKQNDRLDNSIKSGEEEKKNIDVQISAVIESAKNKNTEVYIPSNLTNRKIEIDKQKSANEKTITENNSKITNLREEDSKKSGTTENKAIVVKVQARSMFSLLGEATGTTEDKFKFFLTFLIAILVEIGIFTMKPSPNIRKDIELHEKLIKEQKAKLNTKKIVKEVFKEEIKKENKISTEDISDLLDKASDFSKDLDKEKKKKLLEVASEFA